uniref:SET domain-containing protein n=1 Tax=Chromera velia CCMP2878 TaxID=1169474 RepID=A0A0G4HDJ8_9ALVE|eukprot:Cvel_26533.t1-p1 / transcript=Cvel_26533.t1 / gene=Cvel_26533 / organism=Chromera_velia_CCMP2878 / gene_product=hypothetical protein / transcript_product=hypothetical protein / location=Cvel_scaffold3172:4991-6094(+) / protein_length=368 / sequence_SO=supercontig / SO=protein_coding / is_pseudo=false
MGSPKKVSKRQPSICPQNRQSRQALKLCVVGCFIAAVFQLFQLFSQYDHEAPSETDCCNAVQRESSLGEDAGIALFAGRDFRYGDELLRFPAFAISLDNVAETPLVNYVLGLNDTHVQFYLGSASLINHSQKSNVEAVIAESSSVQGSGAVDIRVMALRSIQRGEEIFWAYGEGEDGYEWFSQREIPMIEPPEVPPLPLAALHKEALGVIPGCATDFRFESVTDSKGIGLGTKVVAQRSWDEGEDVEIARVMVFRERAAADEPVSRVFWRAPVGEGEMLVLGTGALFRGDLIDPNVKVDWWPEDEEGKEASCEEYGFVRFTALRRIEEGDELRVGIREEIQRGTGWVHRFLTRKAPLVQRCFPPETPR